MVGDHRQLGAVGPGGALQALLERHRPAVHILKENIRQEDPNERRALAHLRARAGSSPPRPATRASTPWSTPGPATSPPAGRPPRTPGAEPTSRNSTAGLEPAWPPKGGCRDPNSQLPAGGATPPGTASSPSLPAPTASWSRANEAGSSPSTPASAPSRPAWTTAASSPSPQRKQPPTGWPSGMPSPSTDHRPPPWTPPTATKTAADGSSPTWP